MSRVIVKNLPKDVTNERLRSHFAQQPGLSDAITDVRVALTPDGRSRRFAFVGYKEQDDADKAIRYWNRSFINTTRISVERAVSAPDAPRRKAPPSSRSAAQPASAPAAPRPLAEQDERLKEFLDLSQSRLNTASWRDDVRAEQNSSAAAREQAALLGKEDDDDEYQDLASTAPDNGAAGPAEGSSAPSPAESPSAPSPDGGEAAKRPVEDSAAVTDEDWLRSRTRRDLDLLTADELETREGPAREVVDAKAKPKTEQRPEEPVKAAEPGPDEAEQQEQTIAGSARLFVRNLTYTATEADLQELFGRFGTLKEVHVPVDSSTNVSKGFAFVQFSDADHAIAAFRSLDKTSFQGRLLHVMAASGKPGNSLSDFEISKLPFKKQREIQRKKTAARQQFSWNSLYMSADAVVSSLSARLGVEKSQLLDPTSSSAAVNQAMAETQVIQETKDFFERNGILLDAFRNSSKSETVILAKNFPYGTSEADLRDIFSPCGQVGRILVPPAGTIAIVEFFNAVDCRRAFSTLSFKRMGNSALFLEKAPANVFDGVMRKEPKEPEAPSSPREETEPDASLDEVESTTLFVKNVSFNSTQEAFRRLFQSQEGYLSARIRTRSDPKRPGQILSMGFGFAEFKTKEQAITCMRALSNFTLDGHKLQIQVSNKGLDAAAEQKMHDDNKRKRAGSTKLIIKNLPFEATKNDVRQIFGAYGQLRSVRVPRKFDNTARGFAFAEFSTPREAQNAMDALRHSHFLGRHLVVDWVESESADDMAEQSRKRTKRQVETVERYAPHKGNRLINVDSDEEED